MVHTRDEPPTREPGRGEAPVGAGPTPDEEAVRQGPCATPAPADNLGASSSPPRGRRHLRARAHTRPRDARAPQPPCNSPFVAAGQAALLRPVGWHVMGHGAHEPLDGAKVRLHRGFLAGTSSADAAPTAAAAAAAGGVQPADWSAPLPGTPSVGYVGRCCARHPHSDARARRWWPPLRLGRARAAAVGAQRGCDAPTGRTGRAAGVRGRGRPPVRGGGRRAAAVSGEWIDAGLVDDGVCDCCTAPTSRPAWMRRTPARRGRRRCTAPRRHSPAAERRSRRRRCGA